MTFTPEPGDLGLTRGAGLAMWAVRVGTFSRYGHVAACESVNPGGVSINIVEPMPHGCRRRVARPGEFVWSDVPLTPGQREALVAYFGQCADLRLKYDWLAVAAFLPRFWGSHIGLAPDTEASGRRIMCSEMGVRGYRQVGVDMCPPKPAGAVSPGNIRQWLDDQRRAARRPDPG